MSGKKKSLKLQGARLKAVSMAPYLSTAIWSMHPIQTELVPTMGVDKHWRLYYNPDFLEGLTAKQAATVVIHEVWHLLRDHSGRAELQGVTPDNNPENRTKAFIWNIAADCEINDGLRGGNFELPDGGVYPSTFGFDDSKTAEYYWEKLQDTVEEAMAKGAGTGDGSGACNVASEWELEGDSAHAPATGKGEGDLIARATADEITKNRGTVPGHAERWADSLLTPQVDWRKQLQGALRQAINWATGSVDYSYRRPSRRQSIYGRVVMPSMIAPQPNASVVIDTSGSMHERDLQACLAETKGILEATNSKVTVYIVDAAVHAKQEVFRVEDVKLLGGGGTNMGKGIEKADEDKVHICIVLTDGYTPWPLEKPKYIGKTIICIIGSSRYGEVGGTPEWATRIDVRVEDD